MNPFLHRRSFPLKPLKKSAEPELERHTHPKVVPFVLDQRSDSPERLPGQQVWHHDVLNPLLSEALPVVQMPVFIYHFFTFDADKVPSELLQAFLDVILLHKLGVFFEDF